MTVNWIRGKRTNMKFLRVWGGAKPWNGAELDGSGVLEECSAKVL